MSRVPKEKAQAIADEVFAMQTIPDIQIEQTKTIQQVRTESVEQLAALTNLAISTLDEVMRSKKASEASRLKAASMVLSYAIGRPHEAEHIDDTGYTTTTKKIHAIMVDPQNQETIREEIDKRYVRSQKNPS